MVAGPAGERAGALRTRHGDRWSRPAGLLAHVALPLRNAGTLNVERFVVAIVLLALVPLAGSIDAVWALAAVNLLLWSIIAFETMWVYDDNRFRLGHDLDADIPSRRERSRP